ncbi:AzlD domain-containing protein [Pigmentibacter sp. JX0631]|uniref:AzlD domain-containing protein n=1 Tax=Pigmentibacter sp. JX0631 TaxID=2976982 RepID=UPI0024692F97|nr:AzlD domain-containing protein [Pigmentibacter sp. JX0631]WGL60443.1 AzlD domain-containing protein [Pigmentibacter sp. JX0631]
MSLTELLILISVIAVITFLLRIVPFILPKKIIQNDFMLSFGKKLPPGIMIILFLYSAGLFEEHIQRSFVFSSFLAAIPVILFFVWKRNATISIFIGILSFYFFYSYLKV